MRGKVTTTSTRMKEDTTRTTERREITSRNSTNLSSKLREETSREIRIETEMMKRRSDLLEKEVASEVV